MLGVRRWAMRAARPVVVVLLAGTVAAGSDSSGAASVDGTASVDGAASDGELRVPPLSDEVVAEAKARAAGLESEKAREQRAASRTTYAGLTDAQARDLAGASFDGVFSAPVF